MAAAGSITPDPPLHGLIVCHECDLLLQPQALPRAGGDASCPRCGAEVYRQRPDSLEKILAIAGGALILLVIAHVFPLVALNIQGHYVETTVSGAARQLWHDDMPIVAGLVLVTTLLLPAVELFAIVWLVLPLRAGRRPAAFAPVFRAMQLAHPWAMVEVFMLGLLVALVKLAHLADVLPGPAMGCFAALMLLLTWLSSLLDHHSLWQAWEQAR